MITLIPEQVEAKDTILSNLIRGRSSMLRAKTGSGKTYTFGKAIEEIYSDPFLAKVIEDSTAFAPLMVLSPKPVCKQTLRVLVQKAGVKTVPVWGYSTLSSSQSSMFLTWEEVELSDGSKEQRPVWDKDEAPAIIICDECHKLRNPQTKTFKALEAYLDQVGGQLVFVSATPFPRLCDTKLFCKALLGWPLHQWKRNMEAVVGGHIDLNKPSPKGNARFREFLLEKGLLAEINGIKFLHRSFTKNIHLAMNAHEREQHDKAWQDYLDKIAKERKNEPQGLLRIWVEFQVYRKRSEKIRVPRLADFGYDQVVKEGKQVIIASNFVETLEGVWEELTERLKVDPSKIAILWGQLNDNDKDRNIERFQSGEADILLMTLKTGQEGLNLDNNGEFDNQRPRAVVLPPTWSPIEALQALGRAHRCMTQSTTRQYILWYAGTIEDHVCDKCRSGVAALKSFEGAAAAASFKHFLIPNSEGVDQMDSELDLPDLADKDEDGNEIEVDIPNVEQED